MLDDLMERTRACAERMLRDGNTSADIFAQADEQERTGFSVSAPFTRLLASTMKSMEEAKK